MKPQPQEVPLFNNPQIIYGKEAQLIKLDHKLRPTHQNVLSTVAPSSPADPKAHQSHAVVQPCRLHGALPSRLLPRKTALHHLLLGLLRGCIPHLL